MDPSARHDGNHLALCGQGGVRLLDGLAGNRVGPVLAAISRDGSEPTGSPGGLSAGNSLFACTFSVSVGVGVSRASPTQASSVNRVTPSHHRTPSLSGSDPASVTRVTAVRQRKRFLRSFQFVKRGTGRHHRTAWSARRQMKSTSIVAPGVMSRPLAVCPNGSPRVSSGTGPSSISIQSTNSRPDMTWLYFSGP